MLQLALAPSAIHFWGMASVTELDGALHARVQVREELAPTSHVVHCTSVEILAVDLVVAGTYVEEGMGAQLAEVEQGGTDRRGKGKA